jgi:hypothetical protein
MEPRGRDIRLQYTFRTLWQPVGPCFQYPVDGRHYCGAIRFPDLIEMIKVLRPSDFCSGLPKISDIVVSTAKHHKYQVCPGEASHRRSHRGRDLCPVLFQCFCRCYHHISPRWCICNGIVKMRRDKLVMNTYACVPM